VFYAVIVNLTRGSAASGRFHHPHASFRTDLSPSRIKNETAPSRALRRAFTKTKSGPLDFGRIGTDATSPECVYSGQIGALTLRRADFTFGHVGTDATPLACVYLGQIGALTLRQADFTFGHVGTDATPLA
jgi:hypothetical protein